MTALSPQARGRGLKIAFGELIAEAGGVVPAAGFTRVGKSTLARYYSLAAADAECFPPADVIHDLERLVGKPIVTRFLARESGYLLLEDRQAGDVSMIDLHAAIGACAKEHGEAQARLVTSIGGRALDPADARAALREIDESIEATLKLRALVSQAAEVA